MPATVDDIVSELHALPQRLAMAMGRSGAGPSPGPGASGAKWPALENLGGALGRFVPGLSELAGLSRDIRALSDAFENVAKAFAPAPKQGTPPPLPPGSAPQAGFPAMLQAPTPVYPLGSTSPLPTVQPQAGFPVPLAASVPPKLPPLGPQVTATPTALPRPPNVPLPTSAIAQAGFPAPLTATGSPSVRWPSALTQGLGTTTVAWPTGSALKLAQSTVTSTYPVRPQAEIATSSAVPGTGSVPPTVVQALQELIRAIQDNTRAQKEAGGDDTENTETVPARVEQRGRSQRLVEAAAQKAGVSPALTSALRQLANHGSGVPAGGLRPSQGMAGQQSGSGFLGTLVTAVEAIIPFL